MNKTALFILFLCIFLYIINIIEGIVSYNIPSICGWICAIIWVIVATIK